MSLIAPLEYRYADLLEGLQRIRSAGDAVGVVPAGTLTALRGQALAYLDRHLLLHIAAEQAAVYPRIDQLLGDEAAGTDPGTLDHAELARLTARLRHLAELTRTAAPDGEQAAELRRLLYSLYALARMHIESERAVYLPLRDRPARPRGGRHVCRPACRGDRGTARRRASRSLRWRPRSRASHAPLPQRQGIADGCARGFSRHDASCGTAGSAPGR